MKNFLTILFTSLVIVVGVAGWFTYIGEVQEENQKIRKTNLDKQRRELFEIIKKYTPRIQEMSFEEWDKLSGGVQQALISGETKK